MLMNGPCSRGCGHYGQGYIFFLLTEGEILRKSPFSSKQDVGKGRAFSVNSENALS
jgi:hypothetical protein